MTRVRLRGQAVAKRFGRVTALRGVDFEIAPGDAVSILGANGAGKSTLLRILAGLSRPSEGHFEAHREGELAGPLTREALRGSVGYVGHSTLLYGELSATENLVFATRLSGRPVSLERIASLLDEVGLTEVAERRAGTFSRGMSQRLAIARAIVHEPQLLLLDEPFTGLDESSAERLSTQLAGLRRGGRSLLVVTHDPRRAVELSDRALILHRGEIVARPSRATHTTDTTDTTNTAHTAGSTGSTGSTAPRTATDEPPFEATALRALLAEVARSGAERAA
jgi:heme exporter protein A